MSIFPIETAPLTIPKGRYWLDANTTPVGSVAAALDNFGTGRSAVQATGGQQPVCTANQQAGKNGLVFTSANSTYLATTAFTALSQPATIYICGKYTTTNRTDYMFDGITTSNRHAVFRSGAANYGMNAGLTIAGGSATNTNAFITANVFNGASSLLYLNNAQVASGTCSTQTLTGITLGSRWDQQAAGFLDGIIFEVIFYSGLHTVAQIAYLSRYLSNKWGVAIS